MNILVVKSWSLCVQFRRHSFFGLKNIINLWNLIKSMHILFLDIHLLIRRVRKKIWFVMPARCSFKIHPGTGATKIRTDSLCWNQLSDLFLPYMKLMSSWLTWFFMTFPILFFYYIGCVCDVKETTDGYHREADQSLWGFEGVSALWVNYRWCFKVIFVNIYL